MGRIGEMADAVREDDRVGTLRRWVGRASRSYVLVVVVGLVIGLQVAPFLVSVGTDPFVGTVAVVPLFGTIDGTTSTAVTAQLARAREDPSIDAVVLHVNSGGGLASASEEIYMAVDETAQEMPVVVVTEGGALSGAYYAAVGGDVIFAKPASSLGSVGVISVLPPDIAPLDDVVTTGPDKLTGNDRRESFHRIDTIQRAFVGAVFEQRGDEIEVSREEVSHASIYSGAQAVEYGLADRFGTLDDAVEEAADRAGLSYYDVEVVEPDGAAQFLTQSTYLASSSQDKQRISPMYLTGTPETNVAPTVLMVPPSVVRATMSNHDGAMLTRQNETFVLYESNTTESVDRNSTNGTNP